MFQKRSKNQILTAISILEAVLLIIGCGFLAWRYMVNSLASEVTIEAGTSVSGNDFVTLGLPFSAKLETDLSDMDLTVPGEYCVTLRYLGATRSSILKVQDTVNPSGTTQDLTAFYTQRPDPSDFLANIDDKTAVTVSYVTEPNWGLSGEQQISLLLTDQGGNTTVLSATLTLIVDTTAPEISGAEDKKIYLGQDLDILAGVQVTDDLDAEPSLIVDDGGLDLTKAGVYQVTYTARDACMNTTEKTITVTVIHDTTAPQLFGVRPLSVYVGRTVSYRSNILVTDDTDDAPMLSIDSSQVDLSKPGTYPVIYTAKDCVGNVTTVETTITVSAAPSSFVEMDVIYQAVDKIIAKIITDGMTTRQQVEAIYSWVRSNCQYINHMDKTDWQQAGYVMLTKGQGDCFGFYAVSRLFFERLNIPNLTVQRSEGTSRNTTHYWSLVSVNGGETYYHYDSCPRSVYRNVKVCLVTDAVLEKINTQAKDYYTYDKSLYPAVPKE